MGKTETNPLEEKVVQLEKDGLIHVENGVASLTTKGILMVGRLLNKFSKEEKLLIDILLLFNNRLVIDHVEGILELEMGGLE